MMDPHKPNEFWKVVNRVRTDMTKGVVQPIVREDMTLAVTDEEIFQEMKLRYGKETLDVKTYNEDWFCSVENEVQVKWQDENALIKERFFTKMWV